MNTTIRDMQHKDKDCVLEMMKNFYESPALITNGSEQIFHNNFESCMSANPYLEGYIFEADNVILGYAMAAKSFSTEFGRNCIWIEDLYLKSEYRGKGIGSRFFDFIEKKYPGTILRLEVEKENEGAVRMYEKCGFDSLPYMEMKKISEENHGEKR